MPFDPVVACLGHVVGFACPTFVGDLLALIRRILGLWRASLYILTAACAAGLRIGLHHGRQTVFRGFPRQSLGPSPG